jgi:hypothetical protein
VRAGAHRLALFHHDPNHGDEMVDALLDRARAARPASSELEILAAAEGTTVMLADPLPDPYA